MVALNQPIRIDVSHPYTWQGWGTSLCWMANPFGERDDVDDLLFTTKTVKIEGNELPGLGMNIVRYNAGACSANIVDERHMVLSKNVLAYRQVEGFWVDPKSWDWNRDRSQRDMMLKAKQRGANHFELFSNSPMWWMCNNDNPSGAANANDDNLRPDQQENFAHYLASLAAHAKRSWGVNFESVEAFNEPASPYWDAAGRQEGCHFSPALQAQILPELRSELDMAGLSETKIAASDETSFDRALLTWNSLPVHARNLINRVNVHGYAHTPPSRAALRKAVEDKPMWMSEHGDGDATGLSTAREMCLDFAQLRSLGWVYWQPLDGGGWGFLDADMVNAKIKKPNDKLFVMAQFMRHIRPGMQILETEDSSSVVAYDAKHRKLVLVVVGAKEAGTKTFDLSAFKLRGGSSKTWKTTPGTNVLYQSVASPVVLGDHLSVDMAPQSVETIEVQASLR